MAKDLITEIQEVIDHLERVKARIASERGEEDTRKRGNDVRRRVLAIGQKAAASKKAAGRAYYVALCDLEAYGMRRIQAAAKERIEAGEDVGTVEAEAQLAILNLGNTRSKYQRMALDEKGAAEDAADRRAVMELRVLGEEVAPESIGEAWGKVTELDTAAALAEATSIVLGLAGARG